MKYNVHSSCFFSVNARRMEKLYGLDKCFLLILYLKLSQAPHTHGK